MLPDPLSDELTLDDAPAFTDADLAAEQAQEAARASAALREWAAETQPEPWSETETQVNDTAAFAASLCGIPFDVEVQRPSAAKAWAPSRGQILTRRQQREYGHYRSHYARQQAPTARRPRCARPRGRRERRACRSSSAAQRGQPRSSGDDGPSEPPSRQAQLGVPHTSAVARFAALHVSRLEAR